ncbi:hypothetical protein FXF69_10315 [Actinomadura chibensis]|uniref:Uncharacterized protein n=1 Tax=Actinomadura chibensis TaxID=392828 RepID=A0A5D0NZD8_9ACTN|nr:hypothetical protein FXF69_10315 [Actinomadura chibensis]
MTLDPFPSSTYRENHYGRQRPAAGSFHSGAEVDRTLPALHATGYRVDAEFWTGAKPCCPPNPCTVAVTPVVPPRS